MKLSLGRVAPPIVLSQITTDYTLTSADFDQVSDEIVEVDSGSPVTITVPLDDGLGTIPKGAHLNILQAGAGAVTLVGDGGVTLVGGTAPYTTTEQWNGFFIYKHDTNTWAVSHYSGEKGDTGSSGNIATIDSGVPSGGNDGDVWITCGGVTPGATAVFYSKSAGVWNQICSMSS